MQKLTLTIAATLAILSSALLFAGQAEAMGPATALGIRPALEQTTLTTHVRWFCWINRWGARRCAWRPYRRW